MLRILCTELGKISAKEVDGLMICHGVFNYTMLT